MVAVSEFSTEWNDPDGDGLCVRLAVPAALYDRARAEFSDDIDLSCVDVIGEARYSGLQFAVRRSPLRPGLIEEVIQALGQRRWVESERVAEITTNAVGESGDTPTPPFDGVPPFA
ncbi:hypothetical protein A5669_05020 [Mycolicibacterium fortuitum]|nr:hypothetical protein A5669_05020 [Mycolicibacterium fortuitum]